MQILFLRLHIVYVKHFVLITNQADAQNTDCKADRCDIPPFVGRIHSCDNQKVQREPSVHIRQPFVDNYLLWLLDPKPY